MLHSSDVKKISGKGKVIGILLMLSCLKMLAKMRPHRLNMHQKAFGVLAPLQRSPDTLAGLKRPTSQGGRGRRVGGKRKGKGSI